jgi:hypothetical protein
MWLPPSIRPRRQVSVSSVDKNDERVICASCRFRYPSVRGFCPMCGVIASEENTAPEITHGPGERGLEISRRAGLALRALADAGRRKMIPVAVSTVVLVCLASYFTFRGRTAGKTPAAVPALAGTAYSGNSSLGTSSEPVIRETAAPVSASAVESASVRSAEARPEEKSQTEGDDPTDLWRRVRQGDTEAEVALAKLYLSGIGVERSCEQAHVLLSAASRKGSKAADSLLTGAYTQQCP